MRLSAELDTIVQQLSATAGLKPARHHASGEIDWNRWLDIVDEHQLGPYLGNRAAPQAFPAAVAAALDARYARSALDAAFRSVELVRILELLEGIAEPIVLKGGALAFTLYRDAAERPMSDLDLLFASEEELAAVSERLAAEGYKMQRPFGQRNDEELLLEEHHHVPPLTNHVAELTLELHLNLSSPRLPPRVLAYLWSRKERIDLGGHTLWVLDPVSRLIHHAIHATSDPIDSPLLRNLFEVAWLASKLSRKDRWSLRTLAVRWGIEDRIAPALTLAANVFGSPALLPKSKRGARELWCRSRLEWTDSFVLHLGRWPSLRRSVAYEHLEAIKHGAGNRSPLAFIAAIARVFGQTAGHLDRLAQVFRRRPESVSPALLTTQAIGDRLLAHDGETGNVHVLDPLAAAVFSATVHESSPLRIAALLEASGVTPTATHATLDRLVEKGLVKRFHEDQSLNP